MLKEEIRFIVASICMTVAICVLIFVTGTKKVDPVMDILCNDLRGQVIRGEGWKAFTPPDEQIIPGMVKNGRAKLYGTTGEIEFSLECKDLNNPSHVFPAKQRFWMAK